MPHHLLPSLAISCPSFVAEGLSTATDWLLIDWPTAVALRARLGLLAPLHGNDHDDDDDVLLAHLHVDDHDDEDDFLFAPLDDDV